MRGWCLCTTLPQSLPSRCAGHRLASQALPGSQLCICLESCEPLSGSDAVPAPAKACCSHQAQPLARAWNLPECSDGRGESRNHSILLNLLLWELHTELARLACEVVPVEVNPRRHLQGSPALWQRPLRASAAQAMWTDCMSDRLSWHSRQLPWRSVVSCQHAGYLASPSRNNVSLHHSVAGSLEPVLPKLRHEPQMLTV